MGDPHLNPDEVNSTCVALSLPLSLLFSSCSLRRKQPPPPTTPVCSLFFFLLPPPPDGERSEVDLKGNTFDGSISSFLHHGTDSVHLFKTETHIYTTLKCSLLHVWKLQEERMEMLLFRCSHSRSVSRTLTRMHTLKKHLCTTLNTQPPPHFLVALTFSSFSTPLAVPECFPFLSV